MKTLVAALIIVGFACSVSDCLAQQSASAPSRYFDRFISSSRSVSPYLDLVMSQQTQSGSQGSIPPGIYQNRVRPQLEQRKNDEQQRRQIAQIQTQLNTVKQSFQQRQTNNFGATGHTTRFMLYQQYKQNEKQNEDTDFAGDCVQWCAVLHCMSLEVVSANK